MSKKLCQMHILNGKTEIMVFYKKTFELCHRLTQIGKERYQKMLEDEATQILQRKRFVLWFKRITARLKDWMSEKMSKSV